MREKIPLMKLGVIKEIVEATGMSLSYAYEDLVFLDHNALLLQSTQDSDTVLGSGAYQPRGDYRTGSGNHRNLAAGWSRKRNDLP